MERWKAHGWPCGLWPCCGTSIPMGLGYAVTPLPGDLHSMTSTASTITTTGFITCSSLPPWEGENYEPRNPVESEEIIRELYAAAEGQGKDIEKFVSFFSEEGYMCDIPSGMKFRGQAIG